MCKTLVVLVASGRERRAGKAQVHAARDRRKARRVLEMLRCIAMSHATSACPTCRVKSTSFPTRRGDTSPTLKLAFRDGRCVKLSLATEIYCWSPEKGRNEQVDREKSAEPEDEFEAKQKKLKGGANPAMTKIDDDPAKTHVSALGLQAHLSDLVEASQGFHRRHQLQRCRGPLKSHSSSQSTKSWTCWTRA